MEKNSNISHGLQWGTIIGLFYCIVLFLRYNLGADNLIMLGVLSFVGYCIALVLLFICGSKRKKQLGGFIELKQAFQTMFVAVLIFELIYTLFNFIYLKYIDPDFFTTMKDAVISLMEKSNVDQEQIDETIEKYDKESAKNMNLGSILTSYAIWIAVSGFFALIFALIIRKKADPFVNERNNLFNTRQPVS